MYVNMYVKHVHIVKWKSLSHVNSLPPHGLFSPWNSPGQNTGAGSLSRLHGIFPNQGLNPGLLYCEWILYQLSHKGRPRILDWVAFPFSIGSSQPRDWTPVSCITGRFSTSWASLNIQLINLRIIFLKKLPFLIRYVHYAYKLSQITSLCLLH